MSSTLTEPVSEAMCAKIRQAASRAFEAVNNKAVYSKSGQPFTNLDLKVPCFTRRRCPSLVGLVVKRLENDSAADDIVHS